MKLNTKTITLTGTEQEIRLSGQNCDIRNDGTDTVYASGEPNITAGADGVMSIPSGQAAKLLGCNGTLYLLGTGSVQLCGNDYAVQVFKCAPAGGGSGTTDQTARDTINTHANNTDIHLSAEDVAELVSNGNHLINPDFSVNQRGISGSVTTSGYFVDGWQLVSGEVTVNTDGTLTLNGTMKQVLENAAGDDVTASASAGTASYNNSTKTFTLTASGDTISWTKLEQGKRATPFTPPDPATELLKCQRYFVRLDNDSTRNFSYNGSGFVVSATQVQVVCSLPAPMRLAEPSVTMSEAPCTVFTASKGINSLYETTIAQASAVAGNGIVVLFTIADGVTGDPAQLVFKNKAGQYFDFSAEL